jgi:trigger factor
MSDLSVVTEQLPKSQVSLTVEVPQATVDAAFEKVLNRLAQKAKIEGFRPGKAPRALVEARLGPAAVREEVIDQLVPEVLGQALEERSINPIDSPRIDDVELEKGRPARFTARVSVMPTVTLPDPGGLLVVAPVTEVTEEMVERRLRDLREPRAEVLPVDREVRPDDLVVVDLEVLVDGRPVPSQATKGMEAEVREGELIPELFAVLPGRRVGETAEATVEMPESHSDPAVAGKTANLQMTVRGVKEKRVPELTDELAGELSKGAQSTVEAYRQAVREQLVETGRRLDRLTYEQALLQALVEGAQIELPESMVERELAREADDLDRRLQRQGLRFDRFLAYQQLSPQQWLEQNRPDAESRLRVELVLEELTRQQDISASDEEVLAYMREQAEEDTELKSQIDELTAGQSGRAYFRRRLIRRRTLDRLLELAGPPAAAAGAASDAGKESQKA